MLTCQPADPLRQRSLSPHPKRDSRNDTSAANRRPPVGENRASVATSLYSSLQQQQQQGEEAEEKHVSNARTPGVRWQEPSVPPHRLMYWPTALQTSA